MLVPDSFRLLNDLQKISLGGTHMKSDIIQNLTPPTEKERNPNQIKQTISTDASISMHDSKSFFTLVETHEKSI